MSLNNVQLDFQGFIIHSLNREHGVDVCGSLATVSQHTEKKENSEVKL